MSGLQEGRMKTTFRLNLSADAWKTPGHVFVAKKGNGKGGRYVGGASYTVPKALQAVRDTLKAQGRAWTETCTEDGWMTITSAGVKK